MFYFYFNVFFPVSNGSPVTTKKPHVNFLVAVGPLYRHAGAVFRLVVWQKRFHFELKKIDCRGLQTKQKKNVRKGTYKLRLCSPRENACKGKNVNIEELKKEKT